MIFTTKHTKHTKGRHPAQDRARFSLSAHRMGGEGRGEVGFFYKSIRLAFVCFVCFVVQNSPAADLAVLKQAAFKHYISHFNSMEDENVTNTISNTDSWAWLQKEIPFFECPDKEVEETYYFRWWSFRKHLVLTPEGWVVTEFLTPVSHADVFNTVSCAAGFHLAEGRWMNNPKYIDDYTTFWLRGNNGQPQKKFHKFSSWLVTAAYERYLVTGDKTSLTNLLDDFTADYRAWEKEQQLTNGLYWQFDVRDGMEESISGSRTERNLRPTINSYMFANARSIAAIARLAGNQALAKEFAVKAARLKRLTQENLWNAQAKFFEVRHLDGTFANVREQLGYIPWMFDLPDDDEKYNAAWNQLTDPSGFAAPAGLATAERRSPLFRSHGVGTCEWDGAVWPFATSQTLYALANFLRDSGEAEAERVAPRAPFSAISTSGAHGVTRPTNVDYFDTFLTYVHSQRADGKPYIGEYLDEVTGDWINGKGGRSRYYNHSTFADLLITGIVGLRPRGDKVVEVAPLLPPGIWDYFCLDGVKYHGHILTILWDHDGTRYGRGQGLIILADGKEIARSQALAKLTGKLP